MLLTTETELSNATFTMEEKVISFGDRGDKTSLEENPVFAPKFDRDGLIPAVALDAHSKEPLMLAYMNEESLRMSIQLGEAVYYSRSRKEIWHKGATSGHIQKIIEMRTDCDQDALILYVTQIGAGACHTGRYTCFYRNIPLESNDKQPVPLDFCHGEKTYDPSEVYNK